MDGVTFCRNVVLDSMGNFFLLKGRIGQGWVFVQELIKRVVLLANEIDVCKVVSF